MKVHRKCPECGYVEEPDMEFMVIRWHAEDAAESIMEDMVERDELQDVLANTDKEIKEDMKNRWTDIIEKSMESPGAKITEGMNLDKAIQSSLNMSDISGDADGRQYRQMADWLAELQTRRGE